MSAFGTFTVARLREALAKLEIADLARADGDVEISLELTYVERESGWSSMFDDDDEPQHNDFALDEFMSAAIGDDHRTAAALACRVFTNSNLDLVERRLAHH